MSSLIGACAITSFFLTYPPEKKPEQVQAMLKIGFAVEKAWVVACSVVDVSCALFSFTHGGLLGFLGVVSSGLDLALNYDTWKGCKEGENTIEDLHELNFVNSNNRADGEKGLLMFTTEITKTTVFWKVANYALQCSYASQPQRQENPAPPVPVVE